MERPSSEGLTLKIIPTLKPPGNTVHPGKLVTALRPRVSMSYLLLFFLVNVAACNNPDLIASPPLPVEKPSAETSSASCNGVSVRDYGAVGDGVQDDLSAFQLTLENAREKGSDVCIPATDAHYVLSDTLSIDIRGLSIIGSQKARIQQTSSKSISLLHITADDVQVTGLVLSGPGNFDVGVKHRPALIHVSNADGVHLTNNRLLNPISHGVLLEGVSAAVVRDNWILGGPPPCSDAEEIQCYDSDTKRFALGHQAIRIIGSYKIRVENNLIGAGQDGIASNSPTIGIFVGADVQRDTLDGDQQPTPHDLKIIGNDISRVYDKGIYISTCVGCNISNNTIKYSGFTGIVVGSSFNYSKNTAANDSGNLVVNNHIYATIDPNAYGIHLRDSVGAVVGNNHIYDCNNGILISTVSFDGALNNNVIDGNHIRGYAGNGIAIAKGNHTVSEVSGNKIVNNFISTVSRKKNRTWAKTGAGIAMGQIKTPVAVTSMYNSVTGNTIIEPPRYGIEFSGQQRGIVSQNLIVKPGAANAAEGRNSMMGISAANADATVFADNHCPDHANQSCK